MQHFKIASDFFEHDFYDVNSPFSLRENTKTSTITATIAMTPKTVIFVTSQPKKKFRSV